MGRGGQQGGPVGVRRVPGIPMPASQTALVATNTRCSPAMLIKIAFPESSKWAMCKARGIRHGQETGAASPEAALHLKLDLCHLSRHTRSKGSWNGAPI